jgi:hypothetical protein
MFEKNLEALLGVRFLPANFSKSPPLEKYSMESYLLPR